MSLIEVSSPPTWSELRQTVRDVRSHFSNRGLRTPSCLTFRKTGGRTRLYFLSEPASKRDTSLLYVDLPPTVGQAQNPQWCPLIEAGFQVIPGPVRYTYLSFILVKSQTIILTKILFFEKIFLYLFNSWIFPSLIILS